MEKFKRSYYVGYTKEQVHMLQHVRENSYVVIFFIFSSSYY